MCVIKCPLTICLLSISPIQSLSNKIFGPNAWSSNNVICLTYIEKISKLLNFSFYFEVGCLQVMVFLSYLIRVTTSKTK